MPYQLPDGQRVRVSRERFEAAEVLFQPGVVGLETAGLSDAVHDCINALPIDCRRAMYGSVLLGGGTMMLPGLSTRLERDLRALYLSNVLKARPAQPLLPLAFLVLDHIMSYRHVKFILCTFAQMHAVG